MLQRIVPYGGAVAARATWPDLFTARELDALEALAALADQPVTVGDARGVRRDAAVRRARVRWLYPRDAAWVFERLATIAARMNADFWRLDLDGFDEALQLTRYEAVEAGGYGWHQDYGAVASRKLSLVIQLTDPAAYAGGDLEILTSDQAEAIERRRGLVCAFPAWQLHRVTPVTAGVRHSLVAWATGPSFR